MAVSQQGCVLHTGQAESLHLCWHSRLWVKSFRENRGGLPAMGLWPMVAVWPPPSYPPPGAPWGTERSASETSRFYPRRHDLAKGPRWIVLKSRNCLIYPKNLLEKQTLFYLIHSTR